MAATELKRAVGQVMEELPDDRIRQLLDFARFLAEVE
jgi:hypothetical protein